MKMTKKHQINTKVDSDTLSRIRKLATRDERSVADIVRRLIRYGLKRESAA